MREVELFQMSMSMSIAEIYAEHLVSTALSRALGVSQAASLQQSVSVVSPGPKVPAESASRPSPGTSTIINMSQEKYVLFGAGPAKLPQEVTGIQHLFYYSTILVKLKKRLLSSHFSSGYKSGN
jgi:hypothetical protein